jgi:hypothetical protein
LQPTHGGARHGVAPPRLSPTRAAITESDRRASLAVCDAGRLGS